MIKKITCIECPKGCALSVDVKNCKVVKISGQECPKGEEYAVSEIENPLRILTSTISTVGLLLKMIPVRTDQPIPKDRMLEAANEIRKIKITKPVRLGEIVVRDFMGLGVNLISTRDYFLTGDFET